MAKKKLRKLLSCVLALSMTMSLMSTTAFAASYIDGDETKSYETGRLDDAVRDAKESVTLTSDEEVDEQIYVQKEITVDLNGNDIEKTGDTPVFRVENGGKLTIDDSTDTSETGNTSENPDNSGKIIGAENTGSAVITVVNGTLDLKGGEITGNESSAEGGAVYALNGTVNVSDNAVISNNTAAEGGGIFATGGSNVNISGGTITGNHATSTDFPNSRPDGGGGVALVGDGKVTVSGGTISYNVAEGAGGGIGIRHEVWNDNPQFEMTGGSIIGNVAQTHEGGGIRLEGTGSIIPDGEDILISGNTTNSESDLGGGGIFLVNSGSMTIKNAIITGNHAGGLGGGVAGCIHGEITSLSPDGAAIYGNTADGENYTGDAADRTDDAHEFGTLPETLTSQPEKAQDFFCAGESVVGDIMPGGGSANWFGVVDGEEVTIGVGSAAHATNTMGLTANPSDADIAKLDDLTGGKVIITGNTARNHGGGVATNGDLLFGSEASSYTEAAGAEFDAQKTVLKVNLANNTEWTPDQTGVSLAGYTFELKDASGKVICTAVSDENGQIHFEIPANVFKKNVTSYTFTMTEKAGTDASTIYDNTVYTVQVQATWTAGESFTIGNNVKHTITPYYCDISSITFKNAADAEAAATATPPTFINKITYTPDKATWELSGTKEVQQAGQYAPDTTFKFNLIDVATNEVVDTAEVTGEGKFDFVNSSIFEVTEEGTYTYKVVEQVLGEEGWTYDQTIYIVTVEVWEETPGQLKAEATITKADDTTNTETQIVFSNSYTPVPTGVVISGKKEVNNGAPDSTFKFVLKDEAGNEIETVEVNGEGPFAFQELSYDFDKAGTYTYTVSERKLNQDGWQYDTTIYTVTVVVEENTDGKLQATTSITKDQETATEIIFTNIYKPEDPTDPTTSVRIPVTKVVENPEAPKAEFAFVLKDEDGTVLQTKKMTGAGSLNFKAISYGKDDIGTHTYTVAEVARGEEGWIYDDTVYTVTVEITGSSLNKTVVITDENGDTCSSIVFTNDYEPTEKPEDPKPITASVNFPVTKVVKNSEAPASDFAFVLMDENGAVLQTESLTGAGSLVFDAISYDKDDVGTHIYKVAEVARGEEGWTYDDTVYTVTVEVTSDGTSLNKTVVITNDSDEVCSSIVFTNDYTKEEFNLDDGDVPLDEMGDEDVPLAQVPATGDISALWLMMSALSGGGLLGLTLVDRKRKED